MTICYYFIIYNRFRITFNIQRHKRKLTVKENFQDTYKFVRYNFYNLDQIRISSHSTVSVTYFEINLELSRVNIHNSE